ncbi:MAG: hydrogenase maturation protease [Terrimicrobiaceae bacterium]
MQHIICFGNVMHGDDGFAIHVLRRLKEGCVLPRQVRVFEGGVAGLQALPYFENCRKAIVVDAVKGTGNIGSVYRLNPEDLSDPEREFSLHNLGVNHLLAVLPIYLGEAAVPQIVVIGAEVCVSARPSDRLTPILAASLNVTLEKIMDECMS